LQCLLHETATFGLPKNYHEKVHRRRLGIVLYCYLLTREFLADTTIHV
jgi:hypothetical protein